MAGEKNMKLLQAAMHASTVGDWDGFADTHTEDVEVYANGVLEGRGRPDLIAYWRRWFVPFPNLRLRPLDTMVDDERIFFDGEMSGTHTGTLELPGQRPFPPTGRSFSTLVVVHFRMRDGKMAQVKEFINLREILRQLGLAGAEPSAESIP